MTRLPHQQEGAGPPKRKIPAIVRSRAFAWIACVPVVLLAACSSSASYTPMPSAGINASPASLSFTNAGVTEAVAVSDPRFNGKFAVSGCEGIVTYGDVTAGTLTVTSVAAGSCMLTIGDTVEAVAKSTTLQVSVTKQSAPEI